MISYNIPVCRQARIHGNPLETVTTYFSSEFRIFGMSREVPAARQFLTQKKGGNMRKIKKKQTEPIDCLKCGQKDACCNFGAWVDLEEAKKILSLGLKGDFYHLERDKDFPCGYKVGTSYEDNVCSFLSPDGLCSIHKVSYDLKPAYCKEFPYENGKLSPIADALCSRIKSEKKQSCSGGCRF